ncbi:hypothetical protein Tco_1495172, partial [Tanacetum coccineum]
HMTGNKDFFIDYQDIDAGFVAFGGGTREVLLGLLYTAGPTVSTVGHKVSAARQT